MENVLTKAQSLFDAQNYADACKACIDLLKSEHEDPISQKGEIYSLIARSYLMQLNTPMDARAIEPFFRYVTLAANEETDNTNFFKIKKDIDNTYYKWEEKCLRISLSQLHKITNREKADGFKAFYISYVKTWVRYRELSLKIILIFSNACDQKNFVWPEDFPEPKPVDRHPLELQTVVKAFNETVTFFNQNNNANTDYVKAVASRTIQELTIENTLISISDQNEEEKYRQEKPDYYLKLLEKKAEILRFGLEAVLYPNGKAMSLYQGDDIRLQQLHELQTVYKQIQQIKPDYVIPSLPSAETIAPQKSGCYIATAVYGSYDCPQVWTLRRYRDNTLAKTWVGRAFIRTYYFISPTLVKLFGKTNWFRLLWKPYLDKKVKRLHDLGVEDTPYNDKRR